ncbi:hypothetical protein ACJJTC_001687 [Scirpophaga incertulas]
MYPPRPLPYPGKLEAYMAYMLQQLTRQITAGQWWSTGQFTWHLCSGNSLDISQQVSGGQFTWHLCSGNSLDISQQVSGGLQVNLHGIYALATQYHSRSVVVCRSIYMASMLRQLTRHITAGQWWSASQFTWHLCTDNTLDISQQVSGGLQVNLHGIYAPATH